MRASPCATSPSSRHHLPRNLSCRPTLLALSSIDSAKWKNENNAHGCANLHACYWQSLFWSLH
eukprot:4906342-Amphidinium_carterae.1